MNKLRPVQRAYIAGFFDGEGYVSISKKGRVMFSMSQGTPEVINAIHQMVGCGYVYHYDREGYPIWLFQTGKRQDCFDLIQAIYKYSIVKRKSLSVARKVLLRQIEQSI